MLDPATNVAIFHTAPAYTKFQAYYTALENPDDNLTYSHPVTDDEGSEGDEEDSEEEEETTEIQQEEDMATEETPDLSRQHPVLTDFNLQGFQDGTTAPTIVGDEEDRLQNSQAELLHWHHKLGHTSFHKLRLMAEKGDIPKKLATCKVPLCTACLFGKATRQPWRTKSSVNRIRIKQVQKPGDCVSVDQIESTTPGLVGQIKGFLTIQRY